MASRTTEEPAISVSGLSKTYGSGDEAVHAVEDVSFDIERGEIVGLLGPNGAGKTTTIKSMLGVVIPDAGTVEVGGIDIHEHPRHAYDRIGAMLEGTRNVYWRLTVRENLRFFAGLNGDRPGELETAHEELLEKLDLADRADTPVNDLSRGMKQKVSLASTLASDVSVVLMDEPTLGLDVETSLELRSELRRLAKDEAVTVIISSHDMDVIQEVCDSVVILQDGSIVTHEPVDSLLDVFEQQEAEVVVDAPLNTDCQAELERQVGARVRADGDRVSVSFPIDDFEALETVSELLGEHDQTLHEIKSHSPDLEEAFLEITGTTVNEMTDKEEQSSDNLTARKSDQP